MSNVEIDVDRVGRILFRGRDCGRDGRRRLYESRLIRLEFSSRTIVLVP